MEDQGSSATDVIVDVAFGLFALVIGGYCLYGMLHEDEDYRQIITMTGVCGMCLLLFLWLVSIRKKTVYNYRITKDEGHVEYWLDYSKYTGHIFKGIAITFFVAALILIFMDSSLIWALAGPAGIALAASKKLMSFENPTHQRTKKWSRYDLVFIDRKRKMVVTSYQHNPLAGFEIHLEKRKIDEFVALLKTLMPNAEFREAEWKW